MITEQSTDPDPLAGVKPGDPVEDRGVDDLDGQVCGRSNAEGRFACTRPPDHPGQHIADGTVHVVHTWPAGATS